MTMRARLSYLHLLFLVADHGGSTAFIDARIARLLDDLSLRQAMLRLDPAAGTQEARIVALFQQELAARAARSRRRGIALAITGVATVAVVAATVARWAL